MPFENELEEVLPPDLPERATVVAKASEHLRMIEEMNRRFNLTRIVSPREAAIKHVLDSVLPWRLFVEAQSVLDAGTGAGFPGIPLALALPNVAFTLSESVRKKARFVEQAVASLAIGNATATSRRAEELLNEHPAEVMTARAVAPLVRAIPLFARAIHAGTRLLLYKGPDAEQEMAAAAQEALRRKIRMRVAMRYSLPGNLGERTIVELAVKLRT